METNSIAEAASKQDWARVRHLVERGDDVNVVGGWKRGTGLHYAVFWKNATICELLLKRGANINATAEYRDQPLHIAARDRSDNVAVCELLVAHGANVTAVNSTGYTPLLEAVYQNKSSAVCPLLITNDTVNVADNVGDHALHMASRSYNVVAVQQLVDCGADTNAVNMNGQTPLHAAAAGQKDCPELCEILLKHGAKTNAEDIGGNQPLNLACKQHHIETVKLMVSHGADTNVMNTIGYASLHTVANWPELHEILVKHDAEGNTAEEDGIQPLHFACKRAYTETVKVMVSYGADTNTMNKHGQTPLHAAAGGWKDCTELCEILLKHGAKIDAVDKDGNQPLHLACQQNHVEIGHLFVSYGADVSAVNSNGHSPLHLLSWSVIHSKGGVDSEEESILHIAARRGMVTTVQLLVDCGADSKAENKHGQTPLHIAAGGENDCPELCEILLKHNAEINAVDKSGNQPLHLACQENHVKAGNLFVSYGADVSAVNSNGHSPLHLLSLSVRRSKGGVNSSEEESVLHIAARHGMMTTVQLLLECGADSKAENKHGQRPLHMAAGGENDCPELCEILLKHNAEINAVDKSGNQPLHFACLAGLTSTVRGLLDCNANVSATNSDGQTSLHKAASSQRDCHEMCLLLIRKGVEVNAIDNNGDTSLQIALQKGNMKTAEVLLADGADCNMLNRSDETVLHLLCKGGIDRHELCEDLISHGASPHLTDKEGNLPLHFALKNKLLKTSCMLFKKLGGSTLDDLQEMNIQKKHFSDLLCFAVTCCDTECCQKLLDFGANPNAATEKGKTPLHLAIVGNKGDMTRLLLSYGAVIDNVKIRGVSALERSAKRGTRSLASLLRDSCKQYDLLHYCA